jgi:hypothetical protein
MPVEIAKNVYVETVGDILDGGEPVTPPEIVGWLEPPRLADKTPPVPQPGIYFDMPEDVYFALPCLSQSGIKKLAASPMLFWADSWMNPNKARVDREHHVAGKVYHCRLLEGVSIFALRFVCELERPQGDDVKIIETKEEIEAYISQIRLPGSDVCHTPITRVPTGETKVVKGQEVPITRAAKKEDVLKQLLEIEPEAPYWPAMVSRYQQQHQGKQMVPAWLMNDVEIAAMMIERDPDIAPLVRGGQAEVTLIWYDELTGVPMKARVDKMKVRRMIDLKTFANQRERMPETAIRFEISSYKYNIQPAVYFEGADAVRKIVREQGASAVHVWGEPEADEDGIIDTDAFDAWQQRNIECQEFALKWASHVEPDLWTWVFQQKGPAKITRAVHFPRGGTVHMVTSDIVKAAKRKFREYSEAFGTDPWLDIAPPYDLADEDLSMSATEF